MADGYAYTASYNEGEEPPPLPVGPPDIAPNTPVQLPGGVWGIRTEGAPAGGGAQDQRDLEFQRNLLKNVRVQDAAKAVESAMRFQGMRGYERDLQAAKAAGLSDEQGAVHALVNNAPKLFFQQPQALATALRALRQPPAVMPPTLVDLGEGIKGVQSGPGGARFQMAPASLTGSEFTAKEYTTPEGTRVIQTGPHRVQVVQPELKTAQRANILEKRATIIRDLLFDKGSAKTPEEKQRFKDLEKERDDILKELSDLGKAPGTAAQSAAPQASTGVTVRRKSDGKTFVYRGNPADVPKDKFDLLK